MILKRFTNDRGKLHYFDKRVPGGEIGETSPKNLFVEKHLYSEILPDGSKDPTLEQELSSLETRAEEVVDKIVATAKAGNAPRLTLAEKKTWDTFLGMQLKRLPHIYDKHMTPDAFGESLDESIREYEEIIRPLTGRERDSFNDPEVRKRLMQNTRVGAIRGPMDLVMGELGRRGLGTIVCAETKRSFVIGSNPVSKLTLPGRAHLSDPTTEVWFPIAADVAVTPWGEKGRSILREAAREHVRHINLVTFKESDLVASRSEELIRSLKSPR